MVLPKFNGKLSLVEKRLRNTNLTGNHVYRSHLIRSRRRLRQREIWVLDYLISLMRTQKRAEMTELHFRCSISRSTILCFLPSVKLAVRSARAVLKAVAFLFLNLRITFFKGSLSYRTPFLSQRLAHDQEGQKGSSPSHHRNHAPLSVAPS